ncbi:unnamed protein product [Debaryomyces tyrocola]|nr:unnamed protein product [Debaryomyces tyrocola]
MSSLVKNVIVFGATGQIGKLLLKELVSSNLKPTAVVRSAEQEKTMSAISSQITSVNLALDKASVKDIATLIEGHDAVVFTAGSGGKNLLQVDLDGAVKTFEATRIAKVRRLVLISAIHADDREYFSKSPLHNYYIAKHFADRILMNEFQNDLDFTILKPSALTNNKGAGKIKIIGSNEGLDSSIDRVDVARVIVQTLNNTKTFRKSYNIIQGDIDIKDPNLF